MTASCYLPLDEALQALAGCGITLNNGNSNHAPMVAEALCALGRPEAVMPWIAAYRQRLLPRSPAAKPIGTETWQRALGCGDRFADWAEFFAEELGQWSWREVLDRWMGRLARGFCAAATQALSASATPSAAWPTPRTHGAVASSGTRSQAGQPLTGSCLAVISL